MGIRQQLAGLDATEQAAMVRRGDVHPSELVEASIAAAEELNPKLNAIIHPRYERARVEAAAADESLGDGPFAGVPVLIKDIGAGQNGEPMHLGNRLLKNLGYICDHDWNLVQRIKAGGFIPIGRTNCPEFGSIISTESFAYGACRNPWNLDHSTGGSSGGSAAAVAAGIVAVAHSSDGGGSIRIPASECGLVGLKPSRGRISLGPDLGDTWAGSTTDGCVSRSVRDTAAFLDLVSGYHSGDPYAAPPFERPLVAELGVNPGRLRIGLSVGAEAVGKTVDPACVAAVEAAGRLLESLGHDVELNAPAELGSAEYGHLFGTIVAAHTAADRAFYSGIIGREIGPDDWEPHNLFMADLGDNLSAADYIATDAAMQRWSRRILGWWEPTDGSRGFDILVTPVISTPPPRLGEIDPANPACMTNVVETMLFTSQFNSTGQPAISLPLHWTEDGLPVGVQLVGGYASEALLVRLAAQIEAAAPWIDRRPPVTA